MANGHFNLNLRDAGGLQDEDFLRARKEGKLDELLDSLGEGEQVGVGNMINGWMAFFLWYWAFSAGREEPNNNNYCQSGGNRPFYETYYSDTCLFDGIALTTVDGEPTITDCIAGSYSPTTYPNVVSSTAYKFFVEDDITDHEVWSDGDGREAVHFRSRFLYLPGEAVSNDIKSIEVVFCQLEGATGSYQRARTARARLKDAGGTPITISKTSNQVLLVDYTLTLVAV